MALKNIARELPLGLLQSPPAFSLPCCSRSTPLRLLHQSDLYKMLLLPFQRSRQFTVPSGSLQLLMEASPLPSHQICMHSKSLRITCNSMYSLDCELGPCSPGFLLLHLTSSHLHNLLNYFSKPSHLC